MGKWANVTLLQDISNINGQFARDKEYQLNYHKWEGSIHSRYPLLPTAYLHTFIYCFSISMGLVLPGVIYLNPFTEGKSCSNH